MQYEQFIYRIIYASKHWIFIGKQITNPPCPTYNTYFDLCLFNTYYNWL